MDYDCCLFDQFYKIKQSLKRVQNKRNQAIKERDDAIQDRDNIIQEKENTIQEYLDARELLSSALLKVEKLLLQKNKTFTSYLPSQQHENQGCLRSQTSSISSSPSQDLTSFGKKPCHKEYQNWFYSCIQHFCFQRRSRSRSCSHLHIRVHPQHQSHSCSQADWQD